MKECVAAISAILLLLNLNCSDVSRKGSAPEKPTEEGNLKTEAIDLSGAKARFSKNYNLEALDAGLKVPQYTLPLNTSEAENFSAFTSKISLDKAATDFISKNGFVVIENPFNLREEDVTEPYKTIKGRDLPVFITTDSLLHLYHIQFDETLRQIEEQVFYNDIWNIGKKLVERAQQEYAATRDPNLKKALELAIAYLAVGTELLKPTEEQTCQKQEPYDSECTGKTFSRTEKETYVFNPPAIVTASVAREIELINEHSGFANSNIFTYQEDYSQYVPRGHYTRSEKLKNYFRAMMWYGRMSFLLKGCNVDCLIQEAEAQKQTMAASLIASYFSKDAQSKAMWDKIYSVTSFYVGTSDDLGPYEYIEAVNQAFGNSMPYDPNKLKALKARLVEYRSPEIYGGTGACQIPPPYNAQQADECLDNTKGFRLMGQRFIPDSYMFSNLVGAYTGAYGGDKNPFTMVASPRGPIRGFPRGLDVMSLLGSKRATALLQELDDSNYAKYNEAYKRLEEEVAAFSYEDWTKNLYWTWLFSLRPFLAEYGAGYPTFMQNTAWQDKELTTALASWSELRHDTILYAKQSYTPPPTGAPPGEYVPPKPKPVVGYVEPVPEFYNRLLALTRMTTKGLMEMEVLNDASKRRLAALESILLRLRDISIEELANKELQQGDYDFIKNFGSGLNGVIYDVEDDAKKTTIVADVHTDGNTNHVLEEGIGYVNFVVVAYKVPDGRILIGTGPVMTYYEFKQPMNNRLTDEAWREMLKTTPPRRPEWTSNFAE